MSVLILVRHAHRDLAKPSADNGLSEKGLRQRRALLRYLKRRLKRQDRIGVFSSPKRRCVQTLQPFARKVHSPMVILVELQERQNREPLAAFRRRILRGLRVVQRRREAVVLCSHGDWLGIALKRLCGADAEIKKGGLAEIQGGQLLALLGPDDFA